MTQDQTRALVERLRGNPYGMTHINSQLGINEPRNMIREAADLIERQSRVIAAHEQQVKDGAELLAAKDAEIERLTRELSEYIDYAKRIRSYLSDAGYETIQSEQAWKARALAAESSLNAAVETIDLIEGGQELLLAAIKAGDPSNEIIWRVEEELRVIASFRSRAAGGNET